MLSIQEQPQKKQTINKANFAQLYQQIRTKSEAICQPLTIEDHVVQPKSFVSPPKWHLAHTTWFFETLLLEPYVKHYKPFNDSYNQLFNSYYKQLGSHWLQAERGQLSRPSVSEIMAYRHYVDEHMVTLLNTPVSELNAPVSNPNSEQKIAEILTIGLNHEQQHQELLYMDIKYILGVNPTTPRYMPLPVDCPPQQNLESKNTIKDVMDSWYSIKKGIYTVGFEGTNFSYDNERPPHQIFSQDVSIQHHTVSNKAYLEFIEDGGYTNPKLWLSAGWDWVNKTHAQAPLYWKKIDGNWYEYTLYGIAPLNHHWPVCHVNYYEATAFANWKNCRLPTEQESEIFLTNSEQSNTAIQYTPHLNLHPSQTDLHLNQVWWWTQSHYSPYPGFKAFDGALGEYNGKFMCNQFVLRGGCVATPEDHIRPSYRNFYLPDQQWMFSGIRLAKDNS